VIHEAVEALGNMNNYDSLKLLRKLEAEDSPHTAMVRETVELARDLLRWNKETNCGATEGINLAKMRVRTNDPAPPFNYWQKAEYRDVKNLTEMLLDTKLTAFERNRALFTLRELNTEESCIAICQTLLEENFDRCSSLLKHEVAFVLA